MIIMMTVTAVTVTVTVITFITILINHDSYGKITIKVTFGSFKWFVDICNCNESETCLYLYDEGHKEGYMGGV